MIQHIPMVKASWGRLSQINQTLQEHVLLLPAVSLSGGAL